MDITKQFQRRQRAILAYASQFRPPRQQKRTKIPLPLDRLQPEMDLVARYFGRMIGVLYAEPFVVKEVLAVEDVVQMPVRSLWRDGWQSRPGAQRILF